MADTIENISNFVENILIIIMPRIMIFMGFSVFVLILFIGSMQPTTLPFELRLLMASIVPFAFGLPVFAIRMRHRILTGDPYEEPFGDMPLLPPHLLRRR